jgi:hypothetical protein
VLIITIFIVIGTATFLDHAPGRIILFTG